jgi:hypothetical protein
LYRAFGAVDELAPLIQHCLLDRLGELGSAEVTAIDGDPRR